MGNTVAIVVNIRVLGKSVTFWFWGGLRIATTIDYPGIRTCVPQHASHVLKPVRRNEYSRILEEGASVTVCSYLEARFVEVRQLHMKYQH